MRPFVLLRQLLLLHYLINQEHEVFADKGIVAALQGRMRDAVLQYPETEAGQSLEYRVGHLPESICQLQEAEVHPSEQASASRHFGYKDIFGDAENVAPVTNLVLAGTMIAEMRLHIITIDKTSKSCADPDAQRSARSRGADK